MEGPLSPIMAALSAFRPLLALFPLGLQDHQDLTPLQLLLQALPLLRLQCPLQLLLSKVLMSSLLRLDSNPTSLLLVHNPLREIHRPTPLPLLLAAT